MCAQQKCSKMKRTAFALLLLTAILAVFLCPAAQAQTSCAPQAGTWPCWTTATRPGGQYYQWGYNTDLNTLEMWNGATWGAVGSGPLVDATIFGAKFDGTFVSTGVSIPAGSTNLTCTTCSLTPADVGKLVYLQNANTNGGFWKAVIASFTDANHVVLDTPAPNWMISQSPVTVTVTSTTGATGYNLYDTITIGTGATTNAYPGVTLANQGTGGNDGTAIYSVGGGVCSVQPRVGVTVSAGKITAITSNNSNGTCTTYPSGAGLSLTYFSGAGNNVNSATVNSISSPTQLIVATTKVAAATISATGGSGAGNLCTITGTTGSGGLAVVPIVGSATLTTQKFVGTATTDASGNLSGPITLTGNGTSQGIYNRNIANLTNEPVTITGTNCPTTKGLLP